MTNETITWVPVTERLPDDDTSVLIFMPSYATDGKTIVRASWQAEQWGVTALTFVYDAAGWLRCVRTYETLERLHGKHFS